MVLLLCLKPDGEVREVEKNLSDKFVLDETISLQYLKGVIDNKGKGKIERLTIWDFNNYNIYIYGWTKGSDDILTNHSLPNPLHNEKIYGDLLCFLTNDSNVIIDFTEGFYLDFFQNNWEDNPEEEEEEEEDEEDKFSEDEEIDDEETNTLELLIITDEELKLEPEYLGI